MKKIILILILTIGFVCESKAQENSEIYYYIRTPIRSPFFAYLVQFQNYGKKLIWNLTNISEGEDVDKKIQETMEEHDWEVYNYSSKYSNDKYDTYSQYYSGMVGNIQLTPSGYRYISISKDKQTMIEWVDVFNTRRYYKRVSISDIKEKCAVKIPSFLE